MTALTLPQNRYDILFSAQQKSAVTAVMLEKAQKSDANVNTQTSGFLV